MLSPRKYVRAIELTQIASIDLIVFNKDGKVLVGKRKNRPAQGFYFVPGGRIYKNETIQKSLKRLVEWELGMKPPRLSKPEIYCISDHIYNDNFASEEDEHGLPIGTHYICTAFEIHILEGDLNEEQFLLQHENIKWLSVEELLKNPLVHYYTKNYFRKHPNFIKVREI